MEEYTMAPSHVPNLAVISERGWVQELQKFLRNCHIFSFSAVFTPRGRQCILMKLKFVVEECNTGSL